MCMRGEELLLGPFDSATVQCTLRFGNGGGRPSHSHFMECIADPQV